MLRRGTAAGYPPPVAGGIGRSAAAGLITGFRRPTIPSECR
jgi:hypothetical protein